MIATTRRFFLKAACITAAALATPIPFDEIEMDTIQRGDGDVRWQWYRIEAARLEPLLGANAATFDAPRAGVYACQMSSANYVRESAPVGMIAGDTASFGAPLPRSWSNSTGPEAFVA